MCERDKGFCGNGERKREARSEARNESERISPRLSLAKCKSASCDVLTIYNAVGVTFSVFIGQNRQPPTCLLYEMCNASVGQI